MKTVPASAVVLAFIGVLSSYWLSAIASGNSSLVSAAHLGTGTIIQFALITVAMLLAWRHSFFSPSQTIRDYSGLLILAVVLRLLLIPVDSYASNDVSRYLFDGRIAFEGLDPYRVSHDAPELIELRSAWQPPAEHAKYVTLYPPVALSLFTLAASTGVEWATFVWKLLSTLAGLLTLALMVLILKQAKRLQHLPLVALSPLLILETGVGVHIDSFSTLAVCASLWAWQKGALKWCGFFIGLGTLIKLLPLLLLAALLFSTRSLRAFFRLGFSAFTTICAGYALSFLAGFQPIGSISVFAQKWRFGSPFFSVLEQYLQGFTLLALILSLSCLGLLWVTWRSYLARRSANSYPTIIHCVQWALAIPLLLSPVVFPWYLMPLIPLLALSPLPWLILWVCLLPLSYEVIGEFICCGTWQPALWPLWVVAMALIIGWVFSRPLQTLFSHSPSRAEKG